jgi:hypothetical protein
MEGMFAYSYRSTDEEDHSNTVAEIIREKSRLLVCSLSATFNCHLLWAHYASGFTGVAVEVELPDVDPRIRTVQYRGVFAAVNGPLDPVIAAEQILWSKYNEWAYEKEVRILQPEKWYHLTTPVNRIIAGHRMPPAIFEALRIVCKQCRITLARTGIGDMGIDADVVKNRHRKTSPVLRK